MLLRHMCISMVLVGFVAVAFAFGEKPSTRPANSNMTGKKDNEESLSPEVQKAVDALEAEFMAVAKDPAKGKLREASDFLAKATIPQDKIAAALSRKLTKFPLADAYIKWQLLSAVKGEFEEPLIKPMLEAYLHSPIPMTFIGAGKDIQKQMDHSIQQAKDEEAKKKISAAYTEEVRKYNLINQPVFLYRNALYTRLPKSAPVFAAAFGDIQNRIDNGNVPTEIAKLVVVDVQSWAAGTDKRAQIGHVIGMAQGLVNYKGPKIYVSYGIPTSSTAYKLTAVVPQVDPKLIKTMVDSINTMFK